MNTFLYYQYWKQFLLLNIFVENVLHFFSTGFFDEKKA